MYLTAIVEGGYRGNGCAVTQDRARQAAAGHILIQVKSEQENGESPPGIVKESVARELREGCAITTDVATVAHAFRAGTHLIYSTNMTVSSMRVTLLVSQKSVIHYFRSSRI